MVKQNNVDELSHLPVLPLRDIVVFPRMGVTLFVSRKKSIKAIEKALATQQKLVLVAQKSFSEEDPTIDNIYSIGTVSNLLEMLKLPDGTLKIVIEGEQRCKIQQFYDQEESFSAAIELIPEFNLLVKEAEVLCRAVITQFETYNKLTQKLTPKLFTSIVTMDHAGRLADAIAAYLPLKLADKQVLLSTSFIAERLETLLNYVELELDLLAIDQRLQGRVKKQIDKTQRDYYLNEQLKAIHKELGDADEEGITELQKLTDQVKQAGMSAEALKKCTAELNKLKTLTPSSAEAGVSRSYIDWMLNVPWQQASRLKTDLLAAQKILDADHYGLEKVKARILEYLAVTQRVKSLKVPVLCLVGPPGVGKTSLAQSIARATGREFIRFSLGGVSDEAEIRGHRRTYIGSMPGRILQKMAKVKVINPLFLLDEIDKVVVNFRGDPSAALLEVLDPEQNHTFNDHYLDVDYDLSKVMFVATANALNNLPTPLLDRMEVIRLPGYTEEEKLNIAKRHLVVKQMQANGLKKSELSLSEAVLRDIIRYYTREAGVRNLEREIAKICRKTVKAYVAKTVTAKTQIINSENLETLLGVHKYRFGSIENQNRVGQVTGLAWTEFGGDLLTIEVATIAGKGEVKRTGSLENVMLESIDAAFTVVRSRAEQLGIAPDFYKLFDTHFHVPEGAIKKDGPSAGVAMCTALVSSLTQIPVCADVAMTGEITLRGELLPIGGLKEKLLAALRGGIKRVIIPAENKRDLSEISEQIKAALDIRLVRWIDEVWPLALERLPTPITNVALAAVATLQKADERAELSH